MTAKKSIHKAGGRQAGEMKAVKGGKK